MNSIMWQTLSTSLRHRPRTARWIQSVVLYRSCCYSRWETWATLRSFDLICIISPVWIHGYSPGLLVTTSVIRKALLMKLFLISNTRVVSCICCWSEDMFRLLIVYWPFLSVTAVQCVYVVVPKLGLLGYWNTIPLTTKYSAHKQQIRSLSENIIRCCVSPVSPVPNCQMSRIRFRRILGRATRSTTKLAKSLMIIRKQLPVRSTQNAERALMKSWPMIWSARTAHTECWSQFPARRKSQESTGQSCAQLHWSQLQPMWICDLLVNSPVSCRVILFG